MLTHVDSQLQPTMVDITTKKDTERTATAETEIHFPIEMTPHIHDGEIYLKKGPVFQTAIIAGTMAVKKTYEAIPFCHHIPIESCKFAFQFDEQLICKISCTVKTNYKTGVEMEALHGAMIAALTVYDMCKALSHKIIIKETKLVAKTGGKSTFLPKPLYGLVLTGGKSTRMKEDKALIKYHGEPHAQHIYNILSAVCEKTFISARPGQWQNETLKDLPLIEDAPHLEGKGPITGILSAFERYPDANWFVVACDLVHFNMEAAHFLASHFSEDVVATCFSNKDQNFPEALCAIYTPLAKSVFEESLAQNIRCPVKILAKSNCKMLQATDEIDLANINTPEERMEVDHAHH